MSKSKLEPLRRVRRLLVAIDGSPASYSALASASDIARIHRAEVEGLYVIEVPRTLAVDADLPGEFDRGEEILSRAEEVAKEHKVKLDASMCQARQAGHAVVDEAIESGVDAIVVGVDYHRPHGRFRLGRLPQYILAHAPCEVWLFRYMPPDDSVAGGPESEFDEGAPAVKVVP